MAAEKLYHISSRFVKRENANFFKKISFPVIDKKASILYHIRVAGSWLIKRGFKMTTNFESEMLAGASFDELLELSGVSKEEFEEG